MPVTSDLGGKNYTLGRGQVFFDRFASNAVITATTRGEGERYLGNTPEVSTTSSAESLDHYDSDAGIRSKDGSVQLTMDRSGRFTCDNINGQNLALFFQGTLSTQTQAAGIGSVDVITVQADRFFQLGATALNPSGVRKISNVVIKTGAGFTTTVTAAGNYEVDEDLGRIYVLPGSIALGTAIEAQITFDVAATTRERVISSSDSIYGAVRFVGTNPVGTKRDIYMPYVKLSPDGDYNLKGDDWQTVGFTMEILKKGSLEAIYLDGRPA